MTILKGMPATANIALVEGLFGSLQNIIRPPVMVEHVPRLATAAPALKGLMSGTDHALQDSYTLYKEGFERYGTKIGRFKRTLPSSDWEVPHADAPLVKHVAQILEVGQAMRIWLIMYNARVSTIGPMHPIARRFQLEDQFQALAQDHQPIHADIYTATRAFDESLAYFVSITTPYLPAFRQMVTRFDEICVLAKCTPELDGANKIIGNLEWRLSPELLEQALDGALVGAEHGYGATSRSDGHAAATLRTIDRAHEERVTADNLIDALIVDLHALAAPSKSADNNSSASRTLHFALERMLGGEGNPDLLVDELILDADIESDVSKMLRHYKRTRSQTHLKEEFFKRLGTNGLAASIVVTAIASFLESPESMQLTIERAANREKASHMRAVIAGALSGAHNGSLASSDGDH